jgi:hypothetical protein
MAKMANFQNNFFEKNGVSVKGVYSYIPSLYIYILTYIIRKKIYILYI